MKTSYFNLKQLALSELIFMLLIGVFYGILGEVVERPLIGIICGIIIVAIFATYTLILKSNEGVWSGLFAGILIGIFAGIISFFLGGSTNTFMNSVLFGLVRGVIFGAIAGTFTHVQPDEGDSLGTRLFLIAGSIFIGSLLGAGVGLITGIVLGLIASSSLGLIITAVLASIASGYIASTLKNRLRMIIIAILSALIVILVVGLNGVLAGVLVGLLCGAIAPMLMVASIGAYGGLTARGPIAMIVEAAEAPYELLSQGAVPSLLPSMLLGLIIGTTSGGLASLLILSTILGILGIILGVLGELDRKPLKHISSRTLIDKIIIGADKWPIKKTGDLLLQPQNRKHSIVGLFISFIIGIGGGYAGIFIINGVIGFLQSSV
jgi:hypothetical protein